MPDVNDSLAASLRALTSFLVGKETPREALFRIAQLGEAVLPGARATGLTLLTVAGPRTAVCTSDKALEVDQLQYDEDDGPCLSAYRTRAVVRIDSNRTDRRWPVFSARAVQHGVLSSMSLPLVAEDQGLGALNFYGFEESAFSEADESTSMAFAVQAGIVVANAQAYWGARDRSLNLDEAMQSRAVIEQAKGVLMARTQLSAEAAFDILVRASQRENRKLRDIAAEMVERVQRIDGRSAPG